MVRYSYISLLVVTEGPLRVVSGGDAESSRASFVSSRYLRQPGSLKTALRKADGKKTANSQKE